VNDVNVTSGAVLAAPENCQMPTPAKASNTTVPIMTFFIALCSLLHGHGFYAIWSGRCAACAAGARVLDWRWRAWRINARCGHDIKQFYYFVNAADTRCSGPCHLTLFGGYLAKQVHDTAFGGDNNGASGHTFGI